MSLDLQTKLEGILRDSAQNLSGRLTAEQLEVFEPMVERIIAETHEDITLTLARSKTVEPKEATSPKLKLVDIEGSTEQEATLGEDEAVKYIANEDPETLQPQTPLVSVFMPVKNGDEKILGSLLSLKAELDTLQAEGFQTEINICLNNTHDGTLEKVLKLRAIFPELRVNIYEIEKANLRGAGKIFALNLLYSLLRKRAGEIEPGQVYMHIADDDIGYPDGKNGILSNVTELRENEPLKAVSGTYSTSKKTTGMHFLNSVRKSPDILRRVPPLPQGYGGALTMDVEDFPKELLPAGTSFDAYITILLIKETLRATNITLDDLLENPDKLPIRTNPDFLVEHPEEPALRNIIRRLLRDTEWRERITESLGFPEFEEIFLKIRKEYYDSITKAIDSLPDTDPRKLAQAWHREIRDAIYQMRQETGIRSEDLDPLATTTHPEGEQEFCHKLIKDNKNFDILFNLLEKNGIISEEDLQEAGKPETTRKMKLKHLERGISKNMERLQNEEYFQDPTLQILCSIVINAERRREMVKEPEVVREIFAKAGVTLGEEISITRQTKFGNSNFSFFVESDGERYFMRFHDPLGFRFFQRHSPRKNTYLSTLCENIFAEVLGEEHVIGTLYPPLEAAVRNRFSPQEINDIEIIAQSVLIQPDLSQDYVELINYKEVGLSEAAAVEIFALALADLHGNSLGVKNMKGKIRELLAISDEEIRFKEAKRFGDWLRGPNWVTEIFHALEEPYHADNPIYHEVKEAAKEAGVDIQEEFMETCDRSEARFESQCSFGHLDFKMNNTFINRRNPDEYKIYDFDYVTFIDPAYEAGHTLYSVIRHSIKNEGVNAEHLESLIEAFDKAYVGHMEKIVEERISRGEQVSLDTEQLKKDTHFFAAMTIVSVFSSDHQSLAPTQEERDLIHEICVKLFTS
ncbi:hypothetical protein HOG17_04305 [Candidatus Peregrinibacteria bacterium]|jgi:hypothetical protein|nr:hypothetical protein [Candidatus Peregrinibacteria bacterium]MBT4366126.1 hypothetical protein [Candidatus Peregrinibacteria bacterium]MBT4456216.1 hypothetical protein [Candidatus Peregrinibacteria bacterium]